MNSVDDDQGRHSFGGSISEDSIFETHKKWVCLAGRTAFYAPRALISIHIHSEVLSADFVLSIVLPCKHEDQGSVSSTDLKSQGW